MGFSDALMEEAQQGRTLYVSALFLITFLMVKMLAKKQEVRFKALIFFFVMHLVCLLVGAVLRAVGSPLYTDFRMPAAALAGVAMVGMIAGLLFSGLLPRARLHVPRILQDVAVAIASVVTIVTILSNSGVNLSGLIATSAVGTAVIGFSLQDVISNVAGGLALQVDNSIEVGDWIHVGETTGKVKEIRWRYTAIETRNWETVLIPNSVLMKSQVQVLGRRHGSPRLLRRWVYFNVDYRFQPSDVIEHVTKALCSAKLERVASDPPPNCVLIELGDSSGRYAVRYMLNDIAVDDPTDSEVRTLVYFALQRHGMRLSIPAHAIFLTEESNERAEAKQKKDLDRRLRALNHVELFQPLSEAEQDQLARGLTYAPFTRGEVVTRQGAEAHWLYLIDDGEVSIRVSDSGIEREVAKLQGGSFFGEMSLLTGEKRSATVVALSDVECFRLDKEAFKSVIQSRPDLAEHVAKVLARRKVELVAVREGLDLEAASRRTRTEADLVAKIRDFFSLKS
jgi:small-conductance mechanosensitive channel/CRP-like cAMP-binding protein